MNMNLQSAANFTSGITERFFLKNFELTLKRNKKISSSGMEQSKERNFLENLELTLERNGEFSSSGTEWIQKFQDFSGT